MSGGGNHSERERGNALGQKITRELQQSLKLLFKSVAIQSTPLALSAPVTYFDVSCAAASAHAVPVQKPLPQVSEDPIRALKQAIAVKKMPPLVPSPVLLKVQSACRITANYVSEPKLSCDTANLNRVDCDVAQQVEWQSIQAEQLKAGLDRPSSCTVAHALDCSPLYKRWAPQPFEKSSPKRFMLRKIQTQAHVNPRLFALPIRKAPLSPSRFSAECREIFRTALAQKAGTTSRNIQLKTVFERLHVGLYTAIQHDEQGHLLCVPKNEYIGQNALKQSRPSQIHLKHAEKLVNASAYLVIGFRLDNQAEVRALVPVATLPIKDDGL